MARPIAEKTFANMLRVALNAEGPDKRLREIAEQLVLTAMKGEQWAVQMVADRLDGKVPQAIVGDDEHDAIRQVLRIENVIVDPANPNGAGIQLAPGS